MRLAVFDIETTALEGSYVRMLCACLKFLDEKAVRVVEAREAKNERKALLALEKHLDDAHVIVTWNGRMFDWRFMNQRRMVHGLAPLSKKMHIDWYHIQKHHCRSRGHKQMFVAQDLGCKVEKFEPGAAAWVAAESGNVKAFNDIVKHCRYDVLQLEELHWKLVSLLVGVQR